MVEVIVSSIIGTPLMLLRGMKLLFYYKQFFLKGTHATLIRL
jgi:hypothetical protein